MNSIRQILNRQLARAVRSSVAHPIEIHVMGA